ncbi:hypothetical protein G3A43_08075 [Paraburkholderia aspalathi]|nr:hypothetical protein [Paraburkholderia aspalathi]MBK3780213.1 hypothetical protein [Paraburkholderia aspalathi]
MPLTHTPIRPPRAMSEEQIYARRWAELMAREPVRDYEPTPLQAVLISYPADVDQRAASVAASFICWLGTSVGLGFLTLGNSLRDKIHCRHEAYAAAWGVTNLRRYGNNSGARAIEFLLRSTEEQAHNRFSEVSVNDLEVLEQVAVWLGSEDGQAFIQGCEAEVKRQKDMDTIAHYHANGLGHLPRVKELEAQFVMPALAAHG